MMRQWKDDVDKLDEETLEALQRWKQAAKTEVEKYCEFLVRPTNGSQDAMITMLQNTAAYKEQQLPEGQYHLHIYDRKTEGESKTQSSLRCLV